MNNKSILITGGCGAIGFWLAKKLLSKKNFVTVIDNNINSILDNHFLNLTSQDNFEFLNLDLNDYDQLIKIPCNYDYIFHLAAYNGTDNFYDIPFDVLINSTLPTINILKWIINFANLDKCMFVYAGSSEVYSGAVNLFNYSVPTDENVPCVIENVKNSRWSYGCSKLHGEISTFAAFNQYGLNSSVIRYHNIYGMRMGIKHFIPDFILRVLKGSFQLFGAYDTRSFLYVEDAVDISIRIAESDKSIGKIINVGSDHEILIYDLALKILKLMKLDHELEIFPSPEGSVKRRCPDLSFLNTIIKDFNFTELDEGLKKTIQFYVNDKL